MLLADVAELLLFEKVKGGLKIYTEEAHTINVYTDEEIRYGISVYTEAEG